MVRGLPQSRRGRHRDTPVHQGSRGMEVSWSRIHRGRGCLSHRRGATDGDAAAVDLPEGITIAAKINWPVRRSDPEVFSGAAAERHLETLPTPICRPPDGDCRRPSGRKARPTVALPTEEEVRPYYTWRTGRSMIRSDSIFGPRSVPRGPDPSTGALSRP